ncbi:leucyl aminopeptidase [Zavarzinia sp. CC-PAN008]|uniref:leucyl aminopeptidase n=1 Tax=Zavarzinia sp. CC-PAN008 TaxID=3243332 RepID=UPI003F743DEF
MKISFVSPGLPGHGALALGVAEGVGLTGQAAEVDRLTQGTLSRAMANGRFKGAKGSTLEVLAPAGLAETRVVLVGLGKPDALDALAAQVAGAALVGRLLLGGEKAVTLVVEDVAGATLKAAEIAANAAYGGRLRSYRFDKYHTKKKPEELPSLETLAFAVAQADDAAKAFGSLEKIADGVFFTRDLVTEPANVIYPETLAAEARKLTALGVEVEVLGVPEMKKLGMGSLLGVGQGSDKEPRLIVMQYKGAPEDTGAPLAFIGKGVTFDSGGISIKPAGGMDEMKGDMGGAAAVLGLMKALAGRKAKVNVIGVVGAVENMVSGNAQRPGDVVTSMSGQTIEVLNTDAEGRLVLADALWYTQDRFKPRFMINLATLTGAIIVSLGHEHAGLFSNNDDLSEKITAAGKATGETVWRLPLGDAYDKQINSKIADMQNIGGDRVAGSITAAQFLQRFVNDVPWAHLDIAGTAWGLKDHPFAPTWASGWGVRLLDKLVALSYEGK